MLLLTGRRHKVLELAFSPDGRYLVAGGTWGGAHVWDLAAPDEPAAAPAGWGIAFPPGGRVFVSEWEGWHLWDPATGVGERFTPGARRGRFLAAPGGGWVLGAGDGLPLAAWPLRCDAAAGPLWTAPAGNVWYGATAFHPDGTSLASAELYAGWGGAKARLALRSADTGAVARELPVVYQHVDEVVFSPDGGRLLVRFGKGVAVYDLADPAAKPRKFANRGTAHFAGMAFHPSGRYLATTSNDRVARVWDAATWAEVRAFTWDVGKLYAVAFSPDGTRAAVGSHTGHVLVWDFDV